jgi:hypothetical protein
VTYLTRLEVASLTGYKHAQKQCAFLDENGWCYFKNADGWPKILRQYHDAKMSEERKAPSSVEPNYGVFLAKKKAR